MEYKNELQSMLDRLNAKGAFLTAGNKPNTMTIGWGFAGVMWEKPVIIVPVRPSRFTHDLIVKGKEFAVSCPMDDTMNKLLGYFGSVSGRDKDKYAEKDITMNKCKCINTYVMPGKCMHFECKLIYTNSIIKQNLGAGQQRFYGDNSFHSMFYGEIIQTYSTE